MVCFQLGCRGWGLNLSEAQFSCLLDGNFFIRIMKIKCT